MVTEATRSLYRSLDLHTYPLGNSINVTRLLLHLIFYFTTAMVLEICRRCNSIQRTDTLSYQAIHSKLAFIFRLREGIGHVMTHWSKVIVSLYSCKISILILCEFMINLGLVKYSLVFKPYIKFIITQVFNIIYNC